MPGTQCRWPPQNAAHAKLPDWMLSNIVITKAQEEDEGGKAGTKKEEKKK